MGSLGDCSRITSLSLTLFIIFLKEETWNHGPKALVSKTGSTTITSYGTGWGSLTSLSSQGRFYLPNEVVGCSLPTLNVSCVGNNGIENRLRTEAPCEERNIFWQGHCACGLEYVNIVLTGGHGNFHKLKLAFGAELESCEHRMLLKMVRVGLLPEVWQASPPAN